MSIINNFSGRKYWLDGVVDFSAEIRQLFSPADVSPLNGMQYHSVNRIFVGNILFDIMISAFFEMRL